MNKSISNKISRYKADDKEALKEILEQMEPLVIKYAKLTFPLEFEDAKQEYYIVIIKSCNKISMYQNDAQCLRYITTAVKNKYYDICKEFYATPELLSIDENIPIQINYYDDLLITNDIKTFFSKLDDKKGYKRKVIYYAVYMGMSDAQIGKKLGLTRQYVYLLRKQLAKQLFSELK